MAKHIWMIAYTHYSIDARVRREAEAVASVPDYRVHLLTLKERMEPRTYCLDGVEVQELNVAKYRGGSNAKYLSSYFQFLMAAFLTCSRSFLRNEIDLIHAHNMPNFLVFAALFPRLFGKKIVLDVHDTLIETYASKFNGMSSRMLKAALVLEESVCCRMASRVVCVNDLQRDALVKRGIPEKKTIVLMNLPDPKKFEVSAQAGERTGDGAFRIVYFGTITNRLGVDLVIHAVRQLRDLHCTIEFFIYGDGDGREVCRDLAKQLGMENFVHFSDSAVPLDDLIQRVRGMDLVVVANRKNAATDLMLPVKMLEGMALGIPVVVPKLRTIEHYFTGNQVFYFEAENVQSLSMAILSAYNNKDMRRQKVDNARQFFDKHSWNKQKQDLLNLYHSMTG